MMAFPLPARSRRNGLPQTRPGHGLGIARQAPRGRMLPFQPPPAAPSMRKVKFRPGGRSHLARGAHAPSGRGLDADPRQLARAVLGLVKQAFGGDGRVAILGGPTGPPTVVTSATPGLMSEIVKAG